MSRGNMVVGKWVPGTGLVLNMDPTAVNVIVDILFIVMCTGAAHLANHGLVALRKMAILRADNRNLPLGRFDMIEVIREWHVISLGNQNDKVYGCVILVSGLLWLAHPIADSGLTFNNHAMGDTINSTQHYLREVRDNILFQRNGHPGGWKGIRTETDVLEDSEIHDMDLYLEALSVSSILKDVLGRKPGTSSTGQYPGVIQSYNNGDSLATVGSQEIRVSWRQADWLLDRINKTTIFVIPGQRAKGDVRFYTNEYEVETNLVSERGYDPKNCLVELLGNNGLSTSNAVCLLCQKQQNSQIHNYLGMILFCAEKIYDGTRIFYSCASPPDKFAMFTEIEEAVTEGTLSPVPLPVLGSFIGMFGIRREPGQSYQGAFLHALGAARFFCARQENVPQMEQIPRPEIRIRLLAVIGMYLLFMAGIAVWKYTYMSFIRMMDTQVAAAHVPSCAFEWALKARNDALREWPSAESKPRDVIVSPFFGIVHTEQESDYLGITADPQPSRQKPFGRFDV